MSRKQEISSLMQSILEHKEKEEKELPAVRDEKIIKNNFDLIRRDCSTYVYLIACSRNFRENTSQYIPTNRGAPIGGYVFDENSNNYIIRCVGFIPLGNVPISYRLAIKGYSNWTMVVPVPDAILNRYFNKEQREAVDAFKERHSKCEFQYLQMAGLE